MHKFHEIVQSICLVQSSKIPELSTEIFATLKEQCRAPTPVFFQALEKAAKHSSFVVTDLADLPVQEVRDILVSSFAEKGLFSSSKVCGHPEHREDDTLTDYVNRLWPLYLPTSFGLVDSNGQLVAVSVMADLYDAAQVDVSDLVTKHGRNHMDEVMMYLAHLEERAAPSLPNGDKTGVILSRAMVGIKVDEFEPVENFYIMFLVVREQHNKAKQHGYPFSFAESAHLYSQALSRYFECQQLFLDHPRDYVNDQGRRPFACVNKKIVVNVNLKKY